MNKREEIRQGAERFCDLLAELLKHPQMRHEQHLHDAVHELAQDLTNEVGGDITIDSLLYNKARIAENMVDRMTDKPEVATALPLHRTDEGDEHIHLDLPVKVPFSVECDDPDGNLRLAINLHPISTGTLVQVRQWEADASDLPEHSFVIMHDKEGPATEKLKPGTDVYVPADEVEAEIDSLLSWAMQNDLTERFNRLLTLYQQTRDSRKQEVSANGS